MLTGFMITVKVDQEAKEVNYAVANFSSEDATALANMQKAVGGYIEAIPTSDSISIFVNEDGKHTGLPKNELAMVFWQKFDKYECMANGEWLAGDVLILGPTSRSGRTTSAPPNTLDLIKTLCGIE